MDIKIPYYEDRSRISNSNIGWFINGGPTFFRLMLDGKKELESTNSLLLGTIVHTHVLQSEKFWDEYRLYTPDSVVMNSNRKEFCEEVANSIEIEYDKRIISAYRKAYSAKDLSDEKALEKGTEIANMCSKYILDLKSTDKRTKIGDYQLKVAKRIEENIRNHKLANKLIYAEDAEDFSQYNEFHINWEFPKEYEGLKMQCKSLIDRWTINYSTREITLIDLKTTADIYKFHESVDKYQYYRQLAYYWFAIIWYLKNEKGIDVLNDVEEYTLKTYIVAAQTNDEYTVRVFEMNMNTIDNYSVIIGNTIKEIAWHMKNNLWDHTKDYYEGDGAELLKLVA